MNAVFRVDASTRIGTGHVMRCLTLALELERRGASCRFICRPHEGHLLSTIRAHGFPVTQLAHLDRDSSEQAYASWLGTSQEEDANETIRALAGEKPDWLIVDHYAIDAAWETRLRPNVERIFVVTDLGDRPHDCDVLLNQNYGAEERLRASQLVPDGTRVLAGPWFALIRPEYADRRRAMRERSGAVHRVLVFFGGADLENAAGLAIEALSRNAFRSVDVDLVIGAHSPHRGTLETLAAARPRTTAHGTQPHLADLMARADIALGAGGITTWERLCLGLPAIVVTIAENQRPAIEALSRSGVVVYLGDADSVTPDDVAGSLEELMRNPDRLLDLSRQSRLLVDGLGTARVVEALMPTPPAQLTLRPAEADDVELYFHWANDPGVRRNSLNSDRITWDGHREWFRRRLSDPRVEMFVLMAGALPVGQIRFDRRGDEAWINYSLDALVRGRGWARRLVSMGGTLIDPALPLRAEVKADNPASCAVFEGLGFEAHPSGKTGGTIVFAARSCSGLAT